MGATKDLTGQIFGRLTAIHCVGTKHRRAVWLCRCACTGKEVEVISGSLVDGRTRSCGCLLREKASIGARVRNTNQGGQDNRNFKHGHSPSVDVGSFSPTYSSWTSMTQRCTNPNAVHAEYYFGLGITVCARWRDFRNFLADVGERPEGTTLGRFGDVGNYEPGNVQWMTNTEQKFEQKMKRQLQFVAV